VRDINPGNGRLNQRDSFGGDNLDPQSLHKYSYAHQDPVKMLDPSGNMVVGGVIELNVVAVIQFVGFVLVTAVLLSVLMNTQLRTQIFEASRQLGAAASA
jgi:hypothetical protein